MRPNRDQFRHKFRPGWLVQLIVEVGKTLKLDQGTFCLYSEGLNGGSNDIYLNFPVLCESIFEIIEGLLPEA